MTEEEEALACHVCAHTPAEHNQQFRDGKPPRCAVKGCGCTGLALPLAEMLTAEREAHAATRRELEALRERVAATLEVLAREGCDCDCDHHRSECDDDCVWCFGCRVEEALTKGEGR